MRKIHIVIMIIILIIFVIAGIFIFKNLEVENDDWLNESGDEILEDLISDDIVESHWASEYIEFLKVREIMFDSGDGNFYPDEIVTTKEFIEVLTRVSFGRLDFESLDTEDFLKVLEQNGVIKENEIDDDRLNSKVTKYDVAVMLAKVDIKVRNHEQKFSNFPFTDLENIDEVSRTLIGHSIARGFFKRIEVKNFYPNANLTRAELAEIIYLFVNK